MRGLARGICITLATMPAFVPCVAEARSCLRSAGYSVTIRPRDGEVGEDVFIAAATGGSSPCATAEARNLVRPGEPGYFLWLRGRFVALTFGTGPDEELRIFDLAVRKPVVSAPIAHRDAPGTTRESGGAFDFWMVGHAIAPRLCPLAWRVKRDNRGARTAHRIVAQRFDPRDGSLTPLARADCTLLQADMP